MRLALFILMMGMIGHTACDSADTTTANVVAEQACVDTLRNAIATAKSFFIKVHAGEALVLNGHTEGIENTFIQLRAENPANAIGATRVLARLYKHNADTANFNDCIKLVTNQYLHGDSAHPRLVALESLGKLGYATTLPEVQQDAATGTGGFRAMARWVQSNGVTQAGEDSLAALLAYPDAADYRGAAYALRFKASVSDSTRRLLDASVNRLPATEPARVYVVSALFVHTAGAQNDMVKKHLLEYLEGPVAARFELAEALSLNGDSADVPVLETLLKDADQDVRVAAANALLKISKR
jgi:solute:Na+ symporter, SSS family